jgi:hypothetical protein
MPIPRSITEDQLANSGHQRLKHEEGNLGTQLVIRATGRRRLDAMKRS